MRGGGDVLEKIGGLPVGAVIPLENFSVRRDDGGGEGVSDQAAFFSVGQGEIIGELGQFSLRDCGEFPVREECGIFASGAGETVGAQDFGRVLGGIEADAEQVGFAVTRGIGANLSIDGGEFMGDTGTEIGKRAASVDQREK